MMEVIFFKMEGGSILKILFIYFNWRIIAL